MAAANPRVVVGVDGSPASMEALSWAFDEARRRAARLDVVHAWHLPVLDPYMPSNMDIELFAEGARHVLDAAVSALPNGPHDPKVEKVLVMGSPANALLGAADGADLVVVGSHGRGAMSELLLGSVSHQVVNRAPCPVVVVRPTLRHAEAAKAS